MTTEHLFRSAGLRKIVLIAICIATTLIHSPTTSGAKTKDSYRATFSYNCCSTSFIDAIRHPGEVLKLRWSQLTNTPTTSKQPAFTIVLSASISGPFATVASLKSAFGRSHPKHGAINSKAAAIRLSNTKPANPVSTIRIPANAGKGYYELTTSVADGSVTQTGGSVIRVSP
jgi:hypothetical protein